VTTTLLAPAKSRPTSEGRAALLIFPLESPALFAAAAHHRERANAKQCERTGLGNSSRPRGCVAVSEVLSGADAIPDHGFVYPPFESLTASHSSTNSDSVVWR
jgi:hypothetical protein